MTDWQEAIPPGVQVKHFDMPEQPPGSQRELVLLNGIGAGVGDWAGFPDALRALGRSSIAIDVAGDAASLQKPRMPAYSDALVRTLDALGVNEADLLGVSWGGGLAQETAIRHRDRIGSLVLAVTLFGISSYPPRPVALRALMTSDRTSEQFMNRAGSIYGGDIRQDPSMLQSIGLNRVPDEALYNNQRNAITWWRHSLARLLKIERPTLVIAGEDDPIARPINARLMAKVIPRSELHMVSGEDGGGHLLLYTRPAESAAVVDEFLSRHHDALTPA